MDRPTKPEQMINVLIGAVDMANETEYSFIYLRERVNSMVPNQNILQCNFQLVDNGDGATSMMIYADELDSDYEARLEDYYTELEEYLTWLQAEIDFANSEIPPEEG